MMKKALSIMTSAVMAFGFSGTVLSTVSDTVLTSFAADETISDDLKLEKDMTVSGDLILDGGSVSLNGHALTVTGSVILKAGKIYVGSGTLKIGKDLSIRNGSFAGSGEVQMQSSDGKVIIGGDYDCYSSVNNNYNNYGTMEVGGNFYSSAYGEAVGFCAGTNHVVVFTGDNEHEISFSSAKAHFATVKMTGKGSLKLTGDTTGFTVGSDLTFAEGSNLNDGKTLDLNGNTVTTLGDFTLESGAIVLEDSTLKVDGNFSVAGGKVYVSSGTLETTGNLSVRSGSFAGSGEVQMQNSDGKVIVGGDYDCYSSVNNNYNNYGTMEVAGNFYSSEYGDSVGFAAGTNHVVVFTGDNEHEISFSSTKAHFATVKMTDKGSLKLSGDTTGFSVSSDLTFAADSNLNDGKTLKLNGNTITTLGDFTLESGDIDLKDSSLVVDGNFSVAGGKVYVSSGTLKTTGNLSVRNGSFAGSGEVQMQSGDGKVIVGGDYDCYSSVNNNYNNYGTMEVAGNFYSGAYDKSVGFVAGTDHVVVFTGDNDHEISMNSDARLNIVESTGKGKLKLTSDTTGFSVGSDLTFAKDSNINKGKTLKLNGHTVSTEGSFTLESGEIDLEDSTLNVGGSFNVAGGIVYVSSGTLNVAKDLSIRSGSFAGSGEVQMQNSDGKVIIGGDYDCYSSENNNYNNYGIMAVYGNLYSSKYGDGIGFRASTNHITAFLGKNAHEMNLNDDAYCNTIQMTVGDSLKIPNGINGIKGDITVSPDGIATIGDSTVKAVKDGEGTLTIKNADGKTISRKLIIGDPKTPAPFVYKETEPAQTTATTTAASTTKASTTTKTTAATTKASTTAKTTASIKFTTKASTTKPAETTPVSTAEDGHSVWGDANLDGKVSVADAVAIMQSIGNKDKYKLKPVGALNADVYDNGDGVTAKDALTIQMVDAGIYKQSDLPVSYLNKKTTASDVKVTIYNESIVWDPYYGYVVFTMAHSGDTDQNSKDVKFYVVPDSTAHTKAAAEKYVSDASNKSYSRDLAEIKEDEAAGKKTIYVYGPKDAVGNASLRVYNGDTEIASAVFKIFKYDTINTFAFEEDSIYWDEAFKAIKFDFIYTGDETQGVPAFAIAEKDVSNEDALYLSNYKMAGHFDGTYTGLSFKKRELGKTYKVVAYDANGKTLDQFEFTPHLYDKVSFSFDSSSWNEEKYAINVKYTYEGDFSLGNARLYIVPKGTKAEFLEARDKAVWNNTLYSIVDDGETAQNLLLKESVPSGDYTVMAFDANGDLLDSIDCTIPGLG